MLTTEVLSRGVYGDIPDPLRQIHGDPIIALGASQGAFPPCGRSRSWNTSHRAGLLLNDATGWLLEIEGSVGTHHAPNLETGSRDAHIVRRHVNTKNDSIVKNGPPLRIDRPTNPLLFFDEPEPEVMEHQ
jgi:hypothetical protein